MSMLKGKRNIWVVLFLILFGVATIVSGGGALFTKVGLQTRGDIVPLVLWFNFIAGFFYVLAGFFAYKSKSCVKRLSWVLASANLLVLVYLLVYIFKGGLYETRTLIAMSFRTLVWVVAAGYFLKLKML